MFRGIQSMMDLFRTEAEKGKKKGIILEKLALEVV